MKTGKLESPITVDGTMQVIYDSGELSSAQTSITISNLNGDIDEEYELIVRRKDGGATPSNLQLRLNNDSDSNYGYQQLYGQDTTAGATRNVTSRWYIDVAEVDATGALYFSHTKIYAKSGYIRTAVNQQTNEITTTTVKGVRLLGFSWNNTADNITQLNVIADVANGLGVGSRIILLKKVTSTSGIKTGNLSVQGKIYGVWEEIYRNELGTAATSVTISNLAGNTDVLYRLRVKQVGGSAGSQVGLRPNNDSTTDTYGYQDLSGINTTTAAERSTTRNRMWLAPQGSEANNYVGLYELLLYAKSGYLRTALNTATCGITATTVTCVQLVGNVWNETATEITSLVVLSDDTDGLGVGTEIVLERLNL